VTFESTGLYFLVVPDGTPVRDGDVLRVRATAEGATVRVNGRLVATLRAGEEWTVTPWKARLRIEASTDVVVQTLRAIS
jgi:hypothetical protein